jgi:histidyl-tRNA synthetase
MAKAQRINPVRGTQDIYGEFQDKFAHVVDTFRRVARLYGFRGLEVPVIEPTAVFARSLGETTDVVAKEMYSFDDRGGESVTLRPEFTAGIARAYLSNGWQQHAPMKLVTHGPLFRYERPQKGRYRQFHQIDAEIIGAGEPLADVELLSFADQLLKELGLGDGMTLHLNTLGDAHSREAWRAGLVTYFSDYRDALSPESLARLEKNPLRILDSKDPDDRGIAHGAPKIDDFLTGEAQEFFAKLTEGLAAAGVAWQRDAKLVRGLDYYRHTAFEFIPDAGSELAKKLGSQSTVLGGGRYDGLIENLGGPPTPAVGWAAGIERLAMLVGLPANDGLDAVILPMTDAALDQALKLARQLREMACTVEIIASGKMKKRMASAAASGAMLALVIGEDELANNVIAVKDLASGEQIQTTWDDIIDTVSQAQNARFLRGLDAMTLPPIGMETDDY